MIEFDSQESPYLIIKVKTSSPGNFSRVKHLLPLIHCDYQEEYQILHLAFLLEEEKDLENILKTFAINFKGAEIVETSLSPSPYVNKHVVKFSGKNSLKNEDSLKATGRCKIVLRSSLSFGSGFHPTTKISLELLEYAFSIRKINDVFDLGTGSGILAIASAIKGAKRVVAIDIDFKACREAFFNVRRNEVGDYILVVNGTYSCGKKEYFDLLLANLTISVITSLGLSMKTLLRKDGLIILSGFMYRQLPKIEKSLALKKVIKKIEKRGWGGLLAEVRP